MVSSFSVTSFATTMGIAKPLVSEKNYPYRPAKLYHYKKNPNRVWSVSFYVFDLNTEKLTRKICRGAFNKIKDAKLRYKEATDFCNEINRMLALGHVIEKKPTPLDKLIEHFPLNMVDAITYYYTTAKPNIASTYKNDFKLVAKLLSEYLESKNLKELHVNNVTRVVVADFLGTLLAKGISPKTYNNRLNCMKTVLSYYEKMEVIDKNRIAKMDVLKTAPHKHQCFDLLQINTLLQEMQRRNETLLMLFCKFIFYTYMRPNRELLGLQAKHIGKDKVFIPAANAKTSTNDYVTIPPPLEELIEEMGLRKLPPEQYIFSKDGAVPFHKNRLYRKHVEVLKACGMSGGDYTVYSWKHSGNVALHEAGANVKAIQRQNRHTSLTTTDKYLRGLGLFENKEVNKFPKI